VSPARPALTQPPWRRSWLRVAVGATVLVTTLVGAGASGAVSGPRAPEAPFEVFVHPLHGGGWSAHAAAGAWDLDGAVAPSVAASKHGELVIAQRTLTGDVEVSEGTLFGHFTSVDLTTSLDLPGAVGRPSVWVGTSGEVAVWYRSRSRHLEVASQTSAGGAWTGDDVTALTGGSLLSGDPAVLAGGTFPGIGYAVTATGGVESFATTGPLASWVASDLTDGLSFPPLEGPVSVFRAPGMPAATVLLGTTSYGDVLELSNELAGPLDAVGPWQASDLTELGAPAAPGPLMAIGGSLPDATYRTWSGDVIALRLTSGLNGGFSTSDLSVRTELQVDPRAVPTVVIGPSGPEVAARTLTGDLTVTPVTGGPIASDVSFQPETAQLVASDVGSTVVSGADVLVAKSAGPIASTPLRRRIVLRAASYDQQHRFFETDPNGSYCNPFTAAFGRGSTSGCRRGYSSEEWCSDFAQYVWQTSGVHTNGITGWAASFVVWGAAHHRVQFGTHFTPQPGDAIVWGTRSPLYGTHVAVIVGVKGSYIDVDGGDSWGNLPGYGIGVWRTGPFPGASSSVNGYPVLGVVEP
jgi:hypothetical protein